MVNRSYKLSKYSTIHGMYFYGEDGKPVFVELKDKIKIPTKK